MINDDSKNNDDLDLDVDDDLDIDESFDEFDQKDKSLGQIVKESTLAKVGIVLVGALVLYLVFSAFSGSSTNVQPSRVTEAPNIAPSPTDTNVSETYRAEIEEQNEQIIEKALQTGQSAIPFEFENEVGIVSTPEAEVEEEDPLQRWRRLQEERLERELEQRETIIPRDDPEIQQRSEALEQLSGIFSQQMASILDSRGSPSSAAQNLTPNDFIIRKNQLAEEALTSATLTSEENINASLVNQIILPAGEIIYAQTLLEANSDIPGPVLAEIVTGPLKGSRILGTFEVQDEYLTLNFDTAILNDQSISIDAIAVNPKTSLTGMASDVDHRYLERILLPAAAAFVEGFASAVAQQDNSVIVLEGGTTVDDQEDPSNDQEVALGVEEAGSEIREIIDEAIDDIEVRVKIYAGTPIGILFLEPVTGADVDAAAIQVDELDF